MFEPIWSVIRSCRPAAIFRIAAFNGDEPRMSTWSALLKSQYKAFESDVSLTWERHRADRRTPADVCILILLSRRKRAEIGEIPWVTTGIPAGFHFVFPLHPFTHMAPRLRRGIVPSPSPNLTPDRTCCPINRCNIKPFKCSYFRYRSLDANGSINPLPSC